MLTKGSISRSIRQLIAFRYSLVHYFSPFVMLSEGKHLPKHPSLRGTKQSHNCALLFDSALGAGFIVDGLRFTVDDFRYSLFTGRFSLFPPFLTANCSLLNPLVDKNIPFIRKRNHLYRKYFESIYPFLKFDALKRNNPMKRTSYLPKTEKYCSNLEAVMSNHTTGISNNSEYMSNLLKYISSQSNYISNHSTYISNGSKVESNKLKYMSNHSTYIYNRSKVEPNKLKYISNRCAIVLKSKRQHY